jgi:hypothetical protein
MTIKGGSDFGRAFCEHFSLPANQVLDVLVNSKRDEVFGCSLTIALTPQDLWQIAKIMETPKQRATS